MKGLVLELLNHPLGSRGTPKRAKRRVLKRVVCSSGWVILGQTARYPGWQQRELTSKRADILGDRGWPRSERRDQMGV